MKALTIYLAGGLKGGWRDVQVELLRKIARERDVQLTVLDPRAWQDECSTPELYTIRDLEAVRACDVLLFTMGPSNPSGYGLSVEVGYAAALGKRIVFLDVLNDDWRSRYFGMHRVMSTVVTDWRALADEVFA